MHTHVHSQGDEEEDRYSAQQRGARPHDQYDKADRSALGTDMRRENFRGREIDGRDSSAHIRRRRLGDRCGVVHLLSHPTSLMFSPALLKCYVRRCGTD